MKKILALVLALVMLFTAAAFAEEEEGKLPPMYATLGDAVAAAGEEHVPFGGIPGQYYAAVTSENGTYYRHVAYYDDKMAELDKAIEDVDMDQENFAEKLDAAFEASRVYSMTLPVAFSEMFTAVPMGQEELDALAGKTVGELNGDGFSEDYSEQAEDGVLLKMSKGLFVYAFVLDANMDSYQEAVEAGTVRELVIKSGKYDSISDWAFDRRFHTDGTEEQPDNAMSDAMEGFAELMTRLMEAGEKIKNGEEVDLDALGEDLKEKYPVQAQLIDSMIQMVKVMGPDVLLNMLEQSAAE